MSYGKFPCPCADCQRELRKTDALGWMEPDGIFRWRCLDCAEKRRHGSKERGLALGMTLPQSLRVSTETSVMPLS